MAKEYMARKRVVFNAIDRDNPDKGPQIVELSAPFTTDTSKQKGQPTQWQKLEQLIKIQKKDIVDPYKGFDVTQIRTGKTRQGTTYTFGVEGPLPLSEDEDLIGEWIENQPDLTKFIAPPSMADLAQKLNMSLTGVVSQGTDKALGPAGGAAEETAGDVIEGELVGDDDW
jgi:hypothetical protein